MTSPDPDDRTLLRPLGLTAGQESAYAALLAGEDVALSDRDTSALARVGLVQPTEHGAEPLSAALAVERWVADRAAEAALLREAAEHYTSAHRTRAGGYLEAIRGVEQVRAAMLHVQVTAQHTVRAFDREPYFTEVSTLDPHQAPQLERGVRYQVVYRQSALEDPAVRRSVRTAISMGEEARSYPDLPVRMAIADTDLALLILPRLAPGATRPHDIDGLLVRPSPLLDAVGQLFEVFWKVAVPLEPTGETDPHRPYREVVRLMATGLTDAAIARELGVSERTVQRRIGRLQQMLGGPTRFLLGVQAVRRGWI